MLTIFLFRTIWENGYRTWGRFADMVAMDVSNKMGGTDVSINDVSAEFMQTIKEDYFQSCDIKKLDIGGGMIHGKAIDFKEDQSKKIILSLIHQQQLIEIGSKYKINFA